MGRQVSSLSAASGSWKRDREYVNFGRCRLRKRGREAAGKGRSIVIKAVYMMTRALSQPHYRCFEIGRLCVLLLVITESCRVMDDTSRVCQNIQATSVHGLEETRRGGEAHLSIDENQYNSQESNNNSGGHREGARGLNAKRHDTSAVTSEIRSRWVRMGRSTRLTR